MPALPSDDRVPEPRPRTQLRALWLNVPDHLLPKAKPPKRLTDEETEANYTFRELDGDLRATELVLRVSAGQKPFGTILLRCPLRMHLPEKTLADTVNRLGLAYTAFFTRKGRRVAAVYQPTCTLGQFYDPDATMKAYAGAGVRLDRELFETPLVRMARGVVFEEFPGDIKFPLLGLCLGYPVNETIDLLRAMDDKRKSSCPSSTAAT